MGERGIDMPPFGFREAAAVIEGEGPEHSPTESFLRKLFVAQPQHTGWPAWVDSRRYEEPERPRVNNGGGKRSSSTWDTVSLGSRISTSGGLTRMACSTS
jgi:hypothetical protein